MTLNQWQQKVSARISLRERQHRMRRRRTVESTQTRMVKVDGRELINFSCNDYLGLATAPALQACLQKAAADYGVGAGASHLVTGHMTPHGLLETQLAEFLGAESVLLFSTGYHANLGVISALADRETVIAADRLNHASLNDAALLSRARLKRYAHADVDGAARILSLHTSPVLLATDGVFSMDGDIAPVRALHELCEHHGALLLVDDAHGFGVLGDGQGTLAQAGITPRGNILMIGTLGKAAGVFGAFVAGDSWLIDAVLQFARPYIYTTALPPALAATLCRSVEIIRAEPWRRHRLAENIAGFQQQCASAGIDLLPSRTPIQPLLVGDDDTALALSRRLEIEGFLVTAIRPPTVPEGSARLRITLSSTHDPDQISRLVEALADGLRHAA